jgi:hypothetical protein
MPRFIFNVEGHGAPVAIDLNSIDAAKCEALRHASALVCADAAKFWDSRQFSMTVTDQKGLVLFSLFLTGVEAPAISTAHTSSAPSRPSD